jgi:hypothetical protein
MEHLVGMLPTTIDLFRERAQKIREERLERQAAMVLNIMAATAPSYGAAEQRPQP